MELGVTVAGLELQRQDLHIVSICVFFRQSDIDIENSDHMLTGCHAGFWFLIRFVLDRLKRLFRKLVKIKEINWLADWIKVNTDRWLIDSVHSLGAGVY